MAAVLFIVTIPTEAEERRLKTEYIARKLDLHSHKEDDRFVEFLTPTNKTPEPVAAATTTNSATTVSCSDYHDLGSSTTIEMPIPNTPLGTHKPKNLQFRGTMPKRRGSEPETRQMANECMTTAMSSQCGFAKGSSRSMKAVNVDEVDTAPGTAKSFDGLGFREILSSTKRKFIRKKHSSCIDADLDIANDTCMEIVLYEILKRFQILNALWTKDSDGRMHQIIFTIEFNETYEQILHKFHEWGIGDRQGSTVSVMNCIACKTFAPIDDNDFQEEPNQENINVQKQGAWNRFMNSVRSRLNVSQIVRDVRQDAAITFDFLILLISAAILASFGLVEDSTIFLASSMLISPLMGPIIAGIFGTVIKDASLRSLGLQNELIGILIATIVGFVFGLIVCTTDDRYSIGEGLTNEMLSRCELHSLLVGIFTAIPSGAAAAVSILGGNIGSLVGVAISASLLPPAVNSGLLWALACIYKFFERDDSRYTNVLKTTVYSQNQATELAILGTISMCLTLTNIICIYIMGILVLQVKEIAPIISFNNREFWKHDIKIARDLNKNGYDRETAIMDEFANLPSEDQKALGIDCDFLRNIKLDKNLYHNTWSPISNRQAFGTHYEPKRDNYLTIHQFERLYSTIACQKPRNRRSQRFSLSNHPTERLGEINSNYKLLDDLPRCSTMPPKVNHPTIRISPPTEVDACAESVTNQAVEIKTPTTGLAEGRKWRNFIVTPAEDPLHYVTNPDEIDV